MPTDSVHFATKPQRHEEEEEEKKEVSSLSKTFVTLCLRACTRLHGKLEKVSLS